MKHTGQQRAKSLALHGLGAVSESAPMRAPVKAAMKRDDFVAPRVVSRELDGRFDRFRAGVAEINVLRLPCPERWRPSCSASSTMLG